MSRSVTAIKITPGITYCTADGTPYRADWTGVVHAKAAHATELEAATAPSGGSQAIAATAAHLSGSIHQGAQLNLNIENG